MTNHTVLKDWVNQTAALCSPDEIVWCDGSQDEYQRMLQLMVDSGSAQWLSLIHI